jgi:hypothetical protein
VLGTGALRAQTTESKEQRAAVQLKEVAALERVRQQEAASLATKDEVGYAQTQGPYISVLRIHGILVWIWIRIRGSMPLTNGSGCGSGSIYFHH